MFSRFKSKKNISTDACPVCGAIQLAEMVVLNDELSLEWGLTTEERNLIDRQQGQICVGCKTNLRARTLAKAIANELGWHGTLKDIRKSKAARSKSILEINEAGNLSQFLRVLPKHKLLKYPEIDLQKMNIEDESFDLIVHSDTLEHVPDPIAGLAECRRVVKKGGKLLFTIPIVPTKLTRSRAGLSRSYHGDLRSAQGDMLVHTEYGADFYIQMLKAGWLRFEILSLGTEAALAIIAHKV